MKKALVIGGTGPTGPTVVNGLLQRNYDVTILHSGAHEIEFDGPVEHIHADPHFSETLTEALATRDFDVAVAQYGRLKVTSEVLRGRVGHLVAIGAATGLFARPEAPIWGPLGRPALIGEWEFHLETVEEGNKLAFKMAEACSNMFEIGASGGFLATYIGYPLLYGPRQPGSREWSIVRRILDKRPFLILPDGGLKLESRGYSLNVAQAPLLAIDNPAVANGKQYAVADREVYTVKQRVEAIAKRLNSDIEIISLPYEFSQPAYPLYRHSQLHRVTVANDARTELGFRDEVPLDQALNDTVDWLVNEMPTPGGELETLLGDPFAYEVEDQLLTAWNECREKIGAIEYPLPNYAHVYKHPKAPGEEWSRKKPTQGPL